jgi:hypothetical protein
MLFTLPILPNGLRRAEIVSNGGAVDVQDRKENYHDGRNRNTARFVTGNIGIFREGWQTQEEGIAAAMEKMLMIGYVYGVGGKDVAIRTMNNLNMPARYIQPILKHFGNETMTNERLQQLMANALDMATGVNEIIQEIEQAKKPILRRQASILRKELHEAVQTLQTIDLN